MKVFEIRHRRDRWLAASGFYGVERATQWLEAFRPEMWMDKSLTAADFEILEVKEFEPPMRRRRARR